MDYYGDTSLNNDDGSAHGDVSGESLGSTVENAMRKQEGRSTGSSSKSGNKPAKRETIGDYAARNSGPKRMSNREMLEDVEEAASKVLRRKGDPFPYKNGMGRTGERDAGIEQYHQMATRNKTTVANALADYSAVENAFRRHPSLGIEFVAKRLGLDPRQVAYDYAARHNLLPNDHVRNDIPIGHAVNEYSSRAESDHAIATLSADPKYEFLQSKEGQDGVFDVLMTVGPDGRTWCDTWISRGYTALQRLHMAHQEFAKRYMQNQIKSHYSRQREDSADADRRIRAASRHTI